MPAMELRINTVIFARNKINQPSIVSNVLKKEYPAHVIIYVNKN